MSGPGPGPGEAGAGRSTGGAAAWEGGGMAADLQGGEGSKKVD